MSPKDVVITGSNRGIGFELATQFSKRGDIVIATTIAREGIDEHWNNLGVYNVGQNLASVREVVPSDMQKVFHINENAPTLLASKLLRATKKIVFVSSVAASFDFTKNFGSFLTQLELHSFTPLLSPREPDQACVIEVGTSESLTKLQ